MHTRRGTHFEMAADLGNRGWLFMNLEITIDKFKHLSLSSSYGHLYSPSCSKNEGMLDFR
jgi:hypothetical protein